MERSGYWRVYAKNWNEENRRCCPRDTAAQDGLYVSPAPVYYGGRLLPLETYLAVPTFLRRGRRLVV